jgi:hypothetical protein
MEVKVNIVCFISFLSYSLEVKILVDIYIRYTVFNIISEFPHWLGNKSHPCA